MDCFGITHSVEAEEQNRVQVTGCGMLICGLFGNQSFPARIETLQAEGCEHQQRALETSIPDVTAVFFSRWSWVPYVCLVFTD